MTRQTTWLGIVALFVTLILTACAPAPSEAPAAEAPAADSAPAAEEAAPTEPPAQEPAGDSAQDTSQDTNQDAAGAPTGIRTFVIVPEESNASYSVDEEFLGGMLAKYGIAAGRQDTVGSTQAIEGQFALNWDDLSAPLGENQFTVDLSTLTSDQDRRDTWLRENGPKFADFPTATFVAERLENAPTSYSEGEEVSFQMVGQLTVHEVSHPTTFDVTATLSGDTVKGIAQTTKLLTDFGIEPPNFANTLTVQDEFQIRVEFTAREQ